MILVEGKFFAAAASASAAAAPLPQIAHQVGQKQKKK